MNKKPIQKFDTTLPDGTRAKVRVMIDSGDFEDSSWGTVGVFQNIIAASRGAQSVSFANFFQQHKNPSPTKNP